MILLIPRYSQIHALAYAGIIFELLLTKYIFKTKNSDYAKQRKRAERYRF